LSNALSQLNAAPELNFEDLEEIKIPIELFKLLPFEYCREHQVLPLRFDEETRSLSMAFVMPEIADNLDTLREEHSIENIFTFHISAEVFEQVFDKLEALNERRESGVQEAAPESSEKTWTIALIEAPGEIRNAMKVILKSQRYAVLCFNSEEDFREDLLKLHQRLQEDEDLVNLAENHRLVPFQSVMARKECLKTPKTFCDFVWAHFNHIRVALLEDRWVTGILDQASLASSENSDDLGFFLRHADYYHAAIECFKKGNIFQGVELLEQVPSSNAQYIKAKILLGKAFLKKRNFNKATIHFQKAYDHWCEDPEGLVNETILKLFYHLAYTFEKMGRLDDALKLYERVAAEDPLFREVNHRLAKVKNKRKKAIKSGERKLGLPAFSKEHREQNRYERLEEIGKGGMGIVYRARDRVLGREVALKILNSHFKHDEKIVETFLREAKSLASLNHLNIVTIFDAGIEDGNYYISMEFIDGRTVRDLLKKKGHFRLSTSLALSKQVLKALAYAHSKHVIHRDITTNNMMLTETKVVKLMDFGLARIVNQLHSEQSIIGGTPYFMSPEQVEGAPIDHRTDIYSFGVCLYEMLTGQVPFPMENPGYHHLHTVAPDPRKIKADIPEWTAKAIAKCLEKKPERRFQSADEILEHIRKLSSDRSQRRPKDKGADS